jgi:hypothetical protein
MDKTLVCPCGLTCCDCLFHRKEIYEAARQLRNVLSSSQLDAFLRLIVANEGWKGIAAHLGQSSSSIEQHFEPLAELPAFLHVLDGIIDLQCKTTCRESGGCSIGGVTRTCEACKCVEEKDLEGCWQCGDSRDCTKLSFLRKSYGETIDGNLEIIRNGGVEAVRPRGNRYYAWQRR